MTSTLSASNDVWTTDRAASHLRPAQRAQFNVYRDTLIAWNGRFNLTGLTDPAAIERRLFLDALRILPVIDQVRGRTSRQGLGVEPLRLIDIGSGAGFPGLPLKIARPELEVVLIEATGKKVRFLRYIIEELGLADISAVHARAEEIGQDPDYRSSFDIATARAVASLPTLLELSVPLLHVGGLALFPKSPGIDAELAAGTEVAPLVGGRIRSANLLDGAETCLVIVEKINATATAFPRRPGLPAKNPLSGGAR